MSLVEKNLIEDAGLHLSEATAADYFALLKPRVMSLVVFTAFVGLVAAPVATNPFIAIIAVLAIAVGAGASGALNMWYDADIDALMTRTAKRPIPTGRIRPEEALTFGLILSALSVMTLGVLVNWLAAALLAFTIFFYVVVYTMWLKRRTPQNIVIGGAAGAIPPVIGWAAATGSVSLESVILFLIIFLWTPPHFWALALFKADEYGRAGIPMMPNVAGLASTRRQIFAYALVILPVGVLPRLLGYASVGYGVVAVRARRRLRLVCLEGAEDGRRRPRHAAGQGAVCLFAALSLRDLHRLSGRRGRPAHAGAAGSCVMDRTGTRHADGKPEEGAALALGGDRAGAGRARRHLLHRHDRQVRPVDPRPGDVRFDGRRNPYAPTEDAAVEPRRRGASASPSSAAWSARPTRRCRSTSCSAR